MNKFMIGLAFFFSAIANILIFLLSIICQIANLTWANQLLTSNIHFKVYTNAVLFFVGLGIAKQNLKAIYTLRFQIIDKIWLYIESYF